MANGQANRKQGDCHMTRYDESDPKIIVINPPEGEHNHAEEISEWLQKWRERLNTSGDRFGILLINEVHDHDHEERNEEEENAVTAMITQFRREHRQQTNRMTIGYASVYPGEMTDDQFAAASERTNRFSTYMFGVRGQMFKDAESARAWLNEVAELEPLSLENEGPSAD